MIWFCSGHGYCETKAADGDAIGEGVRRLARPLPAGQRGCRAAERVRLDRGRRHHPRGRRLATTGRHPAHRRGHRSTGDAGDGGAGPDTSPTAGQMLAGIAASITPAKATNAVDIDVPVRRTRPWSARPTLELTYTGDRAGQRQRSRATGPHLRPGGERRRRRRRPPDHAACRSTFDGKEHTTTIDLETIADAGEGGQLVHRAAGGRDAGVLQHADRDGRRGEGVGQAADGHRPRRRSRRVEDLSRLIPPPAPPAVPAPPGTRAPTDRRREHERRRGRAERRPGSRPWPPASPCRARRRGRSSSPPR